MSTSELAVRELERELEAARHDEGADEGDLRLLLGELDVGRDVVARLRGARGS